MKMETWLDLHMHSGYSADGEFAPAKLMEMCADAGVRVAALADHNTMRGVDEAAEAAKKLNIRFFPAIEIDCAHEGRNFHLLGYGVRRGAAAIREIADTVHRQELEASDQLVHKVKELGLFFDEDQVRSKAKNGVIVAEMIAEVVYADSRNDGNELLLPFRAGGAKSDNPLVNFFWEFCAQGKPAYVPMYYVSLAAAVYAIQENGGAAVLAHPGANIGRNAEVTESIIRTGIDGIEAYSNYHDAETKEFYAGLAAQHQLLVTAGSDFHGRAKPAIRLGTLGHPDPKNAYDRIRELVGQRGGEVL